MPGFMSKNKKPFFQIKFCIKLAIHKYSAAVSAGSSATGCYGNKIKVHQNHPDKWLAHQKFLALLFHAPQSQLFVFIILAHFKIAFLFNLARIAFP